MDIYICTNLRDGKVYVGACQKFSERRWYHESKWGKTLLAQAIREQGAANFRWEVIDSATNQDELWKKEDEWIQKLNSIHPNGYNLQTGGKRGFKAHPLTRQKLSRSKTIEHRPKLSEAKTGKACPKVAESNRRRSGESSATAKQWRIHCPDGSILLMTGIAQFCRDRSLNHWALGMTARYSTRKHKGYRAEIVA